MLSTVRDRCQELSAYEDTGGGGPLQADATRTHLKRAKQLYCNDLSYMPQGSLHGAGKISVAGIGDALQPSTCHQEEPMILRRSTRVLIPALLASLSAANAVVAVAHAAPFDRQLFTWTGRVDREVYITMRGRDIRTTGVDAGLPNRARVNDALPRNRGDVEVQLLDGRGDVRVVEQPSARNGYTTTIRISDPRGGADSYRITAYWTGDDRYNNRDDDRYDRDRRDRDDRYDRDCGPNNNGRGGGWGWGRNRDCDNRDRDDRNRDDRNRDDRYTNGTSSLRWSGRVDDVVELRINGRNVTAITRSGRRVEDVNSNMRGAGLPNRDVTVTLDQQSGRGQVSVVQQPTAWNNYTAIIRIYDPQGGASFYDLTAFWN